MNDINIVEYMLKVADLCSQLRLMGMSEDRIQEYKNNPQKLVQVVNWLTPVYKEFCEFVESEDNE